MTEVNELIGEFVNDAKRICEDAYNWNALSATLPADVKARVGQAQLLLEKDAAELRQPAKGYTEITTKVEPSVAANNAQITELVTELNTIVWI